MPNIYLIQRNCFFGVKNSKLKIDCGNSSESSENIGDSLKYLKKLKEINFGGKI